LSATQKTGLVVTAHPGDFVWRAGGAIALHARKGYRMKIVCLSFGERGESQFAWKKAGATMADVKAGRRDEAQRAAELLGAEIEFFDAGDYPLRVTVAMLDRLIDIYRELNPAFVLRGGCHNSLARRPATRKRQAAWSRDWMMKPWRS
jgi:4-oxalomesaconate hydratase